MKQKDRLLKIVKRNPGLTATMYARLMGFYPDRTLSKDEKFNHYYKPASLLRELHRFTKQGILIRKLSNGMIHGKAWRFYPSNYFQQNLNTDV